MVHACIYPWLAVIRKSATDFRWCNGDCRDHNNWINVDEAKVEHDLAVGNTYYDRKYLRLTDHGSGERNTRNTS